VGLTAVAAAMAIFETDQPTAKRKGKARRRLDKLTGHGFLKITQQGDAATTNPRFWRRNDLWGPYAWPFGPYSCADPMRAVRASSTDLWIEPRGVVGFRRILDA
jgi:hypothetical protein